MIDDLLITNETGRICEDLSRKVFAEIDIKELGDRANQPPSFSVNKEYEISLKVAVKFEANSVQLKGCEVAAVRQLKHEVYKDILSDIYEAMNICCDPSALAVMQRAVDKMSL